MKLFLPNLTKNIASDFRYFIHCFDCGLQTENHRQEESLILEWNTRGYEEKLKQLEEENEKLKKQLEPIQAVYVCYKELYNGKNTFFSGNRNGRNSIIRMWKAINKSVGNSDLYTAKET